MAVHLGFPQKSPLMTIAQVPLGKIGGSPLWLHEPQEVVCCSSPCFFLCQILAPGDDDSSYFRYLYIFQCLHCKLPKVLRVQLDRINPYLKDPEECEKCEEEVKCESVIPEKSVDASDDWNTEVDSEKIINLLSSNQAKHSKDQKPLVDLALEVFEEDGKVTEVINQLFSLDFKNEGQVIEFYETMDGGVESAGEEKICNSQEDDDEDIGEEEMENQNKFSRDVAFDTLKWFSNFHMKSPVIRYCRGGKPLWYSDKDRPLIEIERCECGAQRNFECQLLPQLASVIKDDSVEFGSIYIYTCPNSCNSCCHAKSVKSIEHAEYFAVANLKIKERDKKGHHRGTSYVKLELNPPSDQDYSIFDIGPYKFRVFTSIIPGQDPRGESKKECQDNCGFAVDSGIFFGILFDGHGKEGHKVADFCKDFMLRFFLANPQKFEENPEKAIEEVVTLADKELVSSKIDCKFSGSTAVVIVLKPDSLFIGSLGDSRAVLGTIPKDFSEVSSTMTSLNTGKAVEARKSLKNQEKTAKSKSKIVSSRALNSVALTIDQKPNHEEELKRIRKAGGIVERVTNDKGQPIGPYRIWRRRGNGPGLAMSRSMGDLVAHEIGVISIPIVSKFDLFPGLDQFIIIASDGIWDSMDNSDAVHFVDKFRPNCFLTGDSYPARPNNSSVARLLCEEARARWLRIVEDEDVMIDDISCIVIELSAVEPGITPSPFKVPERKLDSRISMTVDETFKSDNLDPSRKDMVRGSIVEASEEEFGE